MWPYHPDLLATPVPRYTSFPTAAEFGPTDPADHRAALQSADGDVSLYLHIPFCEKICFYCGCNTGAAGRSQRLASYLTALHHEIALVASVLPRSIRVRRVAFGGGSPNAIQPDDFFRLLDHLSMHFNLHDPVLSVELDPRSMTRAWTSAIATARVERASLGVQTFAGHCQEAIGRIQNEDLVLAAVDALRGAGVTSINFDLMYGLPSQTCDDLQDTLHRTRVLGPDRIALFGYAHVPALVPRQRAIDSSVLPGQRERFEMAEFGFAYLCTHGYVPVGFDHFARPGGDPLAHAVLAGTLRRNFQGFTDDQAPILIGLGASAISVFPDLLVQNEKNNGRYRMIVSQERLAAARGVRRTPDDRLRGRIIEQLLCHSRVKLPPAIAAETAASLEPFLARRLASLDGNYLTIAPEGLPYARTIAAKFDPFRTRSPRRFSSAV